MPLVFDLDDTLYDELAYVHSGFRAAAEYLAPVLSADVEYLQSRMQELLTAHGRGKVFDLVLAEHGVADPDLVAACIAIYRNHDPSIALRPSVRAMLESLQTHRLYLVTDGDPDVQRRKVDALGLEPYFVRVFRTWSFGRAAGKPSLHCFNLIRELEECSWTNLVYVGDDPEKDFVNLNRVGAGTVRVHSAWRGSLAAKPGYDARWHVDEVLEVPELLATIWPTP